MNSFTTIRAGIKAAIKRRSLRPLCRSIEIALAKSQEATKGEGNTLFSCDSFCMPHLEAQLKLFKALEQIHAGKTGFINFPVSHYITSQPNDSLLNLCDQPVRLLELNKHLLGQQEEQVRHIPSESRIQIDSEDYYTIAHEYEKLVASLDEESWKVITIAGFPFHELSHRDLSLSYKSIPDLTHDEGQPFYRHYIQSNKFNLFLLCLLACEERISTTCFCMSFYTASTVFLFYCQQTGRTFRSFGPPDLQLNSFGLQTNRYLRIIESPLAATSLTKPSVRSELSKIRLSTKTSEVIRSVIDERFAGNGSHTYSTAVDKPSEDHASWIGEQKQLGRQIVSLYTSSPDEMVGQQLGYKHFNPELSHLSPSIFPDQETWIQQVIRYFSNEDKSSCLIIRLHPRLASDKRGLPESPYFPALWERINQCIRDHARIRVVHPADPVSSYWLGLQSELILNGWSTIGLEFAIKGKVVTNAFYKCPLGGAAVYPVHSLAKPLKSSAEYFQRIQRLLIGIRKNISLNKEDYISTEEAEKAFFVAFTAGLVDLSSPCLLHSQLASPSVLTPEMTAILLGSNLEFGQSSGKPRASC
jgi:hypothetical protein